MEGRNNDKNRNKKENKKESRSVSQSSGFKYGWGGRTQNQDSTITTINL
jgi:hypothetical protein